MIHRLRPAESSDFDWLFALKRESYRRWVEQLFGRWDDAEQRARFAPAFAANPIEVLEVEGERVGALSVERDADPVALLSIELLPRWQGRGLGTRVVHDVIQQARSQGRAVALRVLGPNRLAQALYTRMGFAEVGRSSTHVRMRWSETEAAERALRTSVAPWSDASRRRVWARRLFDVPPAEHLGFIRFVAGRHGLPERSSVLEVDCGPGRLLRPLAGLGWRVTAHEPDPDYRAAATGVAEAAGEAVAVRPGSAEQLSGSEEHDLALALGGALLRRIEHEARVEAARRLHDALRPGGVLILECPNIPWVLRNEREPPPRTEVYHRAAVSRLPAQRLDFHRGVLEQHDLWVVEVDGEEAAQWTERRALALEGRPALCLALREAGLVELETFTDLGSVQAGRAVGRRILLTARRPG